MDTTIIISLLAIGLSLAMLFVMRLKRRKETSDEFAYGDIPHLPEGMAANRENSSGGSGLRDQRPGNLKQRTNPFRTGDGAY